MLQLSLLKHLPFVLAVDVTPRKSNDNTYQTDIACLVACILSFTIAVDGM